MTHFSQLPSQVPGAPLCAADRLDTFYDYVWSRGAAAQIRSRRKMVSRQSAGLRKVASWFVPTDAECAAAKARLHTKKRDQKLAVLAAIDMWRSLTIEQAAAILGMPELLENSAAIIRDLYMLDLVDVGCFEGFTDRVVQTSDVGEWLIRPTRSAQYRTLIEPHLTFPEAVRVTGGQEFLTGGQYDRHNILASEFALRVAELTAASMVLGEKWSTQSGLLYEGWGHQDPYAHVNGRGDLTIVRRDGLRIVVEITASLGKSFQAKALRWASRLSAGSLEAQGTVVLFVTAGEQHPVSADRKSLHSQVRSAITQATRSHPGLPGTSRTSERMFVANWADLFPARHEASGDFTSLTCWSPAGVTASSPVTGPAPSWHSAAAAESDRVGMRSLLDEGDVIYRPGSALDPLALVSNSRALLGVPWWMRQERPPQVAMDLARAMWPNGLPNLQPSDLAGRGGAAAVTMPDRVLL